MKLGVATVITDESIRPDVLAKTLEECGFDSLVVAEHSHIPTSRATPFPAGGGLPREYYRSYDPFVALTAAATASPERDGITLGGCPWPSRLRTWSPHSWAFSTVQPTFQSVASSPKA
jgi:alkanesulfonate monooxygenase SsuD/methylene tetrahydromethanopterin reductase-like flavin-dependent oxidoreductase (luciferase family)